MFFSTCSAGGLSGPDFCFIFAPCGYDEPEILPSGSPSIGLTGADGGHFQKYRPKRLEEVRGHPELVKWMVRQISSQEGASVLISGPVGIVKTLSGHLYAKA